MHKNDQKLFLFKMSHLSLKLQIFLSSVLLLLDTSLIDLFLGPLVGYNSGLNMAADLGPVLALFNSIFAFLHNVTVFVVDTEITSCKVSQYLKVF